MRIALCQIDPTVGDFRGNAARIERDARRAHELGAEMAVFPELAMCGYPPRDLLDRDRFVDEGTAVLDELAGRLPPELTVLAGFVDRSRASRSGGRVGRRLFNAVAVMRGGRVESRIYKRLLPSYDVFDELRYFEPGNASAPIEVAGRRIGVTVCEDIWNAADSALAQRRYQVNPVEELVAAGAEVVVNLSASPFTLPKRVGRPRMLADVARKHRVPVVFVNQVGGNDDLIFDGASAVYGSDGSVWARLGSFQEDFAVVPLGPGGPVCEEPSSDEEAALGALTLGVRDYARKCGFDGAVIGLSGGIDSALTACIAARALGPERVVAVAMPTRYSSRSSVDDAEALATALGIRYRSIPIDDLFQAYIDVLEPQLDDLGSPGGGDVVFENIQARIRGNVLMAISNRCGLLLLSTGNKSELAVGYTTLYGDMAGGLAVISDLPKSFVYRAAHEVNRQAGREVIPESTLTKAPSAELRPDQKDTDSLPPYEMLDAILQRYVEEGAPLDVIVGEGFDRKTVERIVRLVRRNEYKRRQMPPGLILSSKAFGPGRRYPIAQGYDG